MSKRYDVGIITGWSNCGGSTESYINMTNVFNDNGISTVMIGPHDYHLDKCNGEKLDPSILNYDFKNVIWHFLSYPELTTLKWKNVNFVLSTHETRLNKIFERYDPQMRFELVNHYHFVSEHQMKYQLESTGTKQTDEMVIIQDQQPWF